MVCYCCDLCAKKITEAHRVSLPKLVPIQTVFVNGKAVGTFGKTWEIVNLDLCKNCMVEIGNRLSDTWGEEI